MALERLTHIGICVTDLDRAVHFYRDLLGFRYLSELRIAGEPAATLLQLAGVDLHAKYLERDGTRIELLHYVAPGTTGTSEPRPMNQRGLTHLSMRVTDLAALLDRLRAEGVRVLDQTHIDIPAFEAAAVFITDPDGTLVELVQSPGDPQLPPGAA